MTTISKARVMTAGENQFCEIRKRYCTLLYVVNERKEYYVEASCDNFSIDRREPIEYAIQFLQYQSMTLTSYPYDAELFKEIEVAANIQFLEMKKEEKIKGVS